MRKLVDLGQQVAVIEYWEGWDFPKTILSEFNELERIKRLSDEGKATRITQQQEERLTELSGTLIYRRPDIAQILILSDPDKYGSVFKMAGSVFIKIREAIEELEKEVKAIPPWSLPDAYQDHIS